MYFAIIQRSVEKRLEVLWDRVIEQMNQVINSLDVQSYIYV